MRKGGKMNIRIAIAQTKPVTGDLAGNVKQIIRDIRKAREGKADMIVFPETAITGYCCGALFEQEEFVRDNKKFLEDIIAKEVPEDLVAVVGFVDVKGKRKGLSPDISNSVAVIQDGRVVDVYDKVLLANGNHHEDRKYFTPGKDAHVADVMVRGRKVRIGTPICEDAWNSEHERDIIQEMKSLGAEIILCPNYSYFHYGKHKIRHDMFREHAKEKAIPVVMANAAGVGDIVKNIMIYDGGSFAYDSGGNLAAQLKRFGEDFRIVDIDLKEQAKSPIEEKPQEKYEEIFDALVFEQMELFRVLGMQKAQVHMSGGIDSAVTGAIVAAAMGPENTVFITNPSKINTEATKSNAKHIADQLGVKLYWNNVQKPYEAVVDEHINAFGEEPTPLGHDAVQAVLRTVQGIAASHTYRSGIVATGNHTEIVLGWATFHDIGSVGVHAVIGDLTKTEVYRLAEYINNRVGKEVVPIHLYDGRIMPAAELPSVMEDPIDYYAMSGICAEIIRNRKSIDGIIESYAKKELTPEFFPHDNMGRTIYQRLSKEEFSKLVEDAYTRSRQSVFKCAQAAPTVIISPRSRGFSSRETIINKYPGRYDIESVREDMRRN